MKSAKHFRSAVVSVSLLLTAVAGTVSAATDEAVIQCRQKVMTAVGSHVGAVADIFKNQLPYGKDRIAEHVFRLSGGCSCHMDVTGQTAK